MEIESIKKLNIKKGDCLIINVSFTLGIHQLESLRTQGEHILKILGFEKNDVKIVILDNGITLSTLSKE